MAKVVDVLFRHWLRFVVLIVLVPIVAAVNAVIYFPSYQASAQLWVDSPTYFGVAPQVSGWNQYATPAQNEVDSINQLVQTATFKQQVGARLMSSHVVSTAAERDSVLNTIPAHLQATYTGSHLVNVYFSCRKPRVCLEVLNDTIQLHQDFLKQEEQSQAQLALDFYTGQIVEAKDDLQASQREVNLYLITHPTVNPAAAATDSQFQQLQAEVQQHQQSLNDLQNRLAAIQFNSAASNDINSNITRMVAPPRVFSSGHFPSASLKTVALIAGGAALPGLAYLSLLAWLDRTTRNVAEIENRLGVRVLATLPALQPWERLA